MKEKTHLQNSIFTLKVELQKAVQKSLSTRNTNITDIIKDLITGIKTLEQKEEQIKKAPCSIPY